MKVGIIQPNYLPWRGYFDFIASVDLFIFHDDLQYTKGDWRNRNRLKTPSGPRWISVPVRYRHTKQRINETPIDWQQPWAAHHLAMLRQHYHECPYLGDALSLLAPLQQPDLATISELNIALTHNICEYLQIRTPLLRSSTLGASGSKTERLLGLLRQVDATTYLSGPAASCYLDVHLLQQHGIAVEYKAYSYPVYPQPWPPFEHAVSIIDTIACLGPEAIAASRSLTPDIRVGQ